MLPFSETRGVLAGSTTDVSAEATETGSEDAVVPGALSFAATDAATGTAEATSSGTAVRTLCEPLTEAGAEVTTALRVSRGSGRTSVRVPCSLEAVDGLPDAREAPRRLRLRVATPAVVPTWLATVGSVASTACVVRAGFTLGAASRRVAATFSPSVVEIGACTFWMAAMSCPFRRRPTPWIPNELAMACSSGRSMAERPVPDRRRRGEPASTDDVDVWDSADSRALSGSTSVVSLKMFLP